MRYYLDTNIVAFSIFDQNKGDNLDRNVLSILEDYSNVFYVGSISALEIIHLFQIGKIKHSKLKTTTDILSAIEFLNYEIIPTNKYHLSSYCKFHPVPGHKDPYDHIIIAQAISDKIPLISSDNTFKEYQSQGLELVFNKR